MMNHRKNTRFNKSLLKSKYIWAGILTGTLIGLFNSGNLCPMPAHFPYSHGIWNVIGTTFILLLYFLFLVVKIRCNNRNKQ